MLDAGLDTTVNTHTHTSLWDSLSKAMREEFGHITYRNWLGHLRFKNLAADMLCLVAPTKFISEWIETNYLPGLMRLCANLGLNVSNIKIEVDSALQVLAGDAPQQATVTATTVAVEPGCDIFDFTLDTRFTFETFVVGGSNKGAYTAACGVAKGEGLTMLGNVLYIHGAVGQGKTHLLQSIASVLRNEGRKRVAYLSAEKFMHLYLKYMRANELIAFKEKIKSCDIFLVDDLQFICGKTATQQEFGNLLSALTEANRMVVISSDTTPFGLALDARSRSRLVGGFVVEIGPSDYELRLNILRAKAVSSRLQIEDEVLGFIATNITASNRELEGALNRLIAYVNFEGGEVSIRTASNILQANINAGKPQITLGTILDAVARYFKTEVSEVTSKSRAARLILPRQVFSYLAKNLTSKSLHEIGKSLGGRNHACVIYYVKQIESKLKQDSTLLSTIEAIKGSLGG